MNGSTSRAVGTVARARETISVVLDRLDARLAKIARHFPEGLTNGPIAPATLAAFLGLVTIDKNSLWHDEAFSVSAARLPTLSLLRYLWQNEMHASPYYLALHPWLALGEGEAQVRLLSVVFGVVAVLATYAIGSRFGVGFPAAMVLAATPFFIQFEQETRGYTMLAAGSAISSLAYLRLLEHFTLLRGLVYVACGAAIIYVHPLGALVIVAHALGSLVLAVPRIRLRVLLLFVPIVVGWIPMLRFSLIHTGKIEWIPPLTPELALEYLITLGGGGVLAVALAGLAIRGIRRDVISLWLLVPIIGAIAISVLVQPTMQARYLISVLPAAAIIIARNRAILVTGFVIASLVGVANWYVNGTKEDWRGAVAWVQSQARPGDGIVFVPHYDRLSFEVYGQAGEPLYPAVEWRRYMPDWGLGNVPEVVYNERIWFFNSRNRSIPENVARLIEPYQQVAEYRFGETVPLVKLLIRRSAS